MRVSKNTPTLLVLDWSPWLAALFCIPFILIGASQVWADVAAGAFGEGFLVGVFFVGIGGFMFFAAARRKQLILDVQANKVTIRTRALTGFKEVEFPLRELKSARCERSYGKQTTYKLYLEFSAQSAKTVAINQYSTSWGNYPAAETTINTWLKNHAPVDSAPPQA